MSSLTPEFLARLRFDANHAATLRALGEYRGKQELFFRQAPEVLKGLRQIAVIESIVEPARGRDCSREPAKGAGDQAHEAARSI
jgi:hypothetical protein